MARPVLYVKKDNLGFFRVAEVTHISFSRLYRPMIELDVGILFIHPVRDWAEYEIRFSDKDSTTMKFTGNLELFMAEYEPKINKFHKVSLTFEAKEIPMEGQHD